MFFAPFMMRRAVIESSILLVLWKERRQMKSSNMLGIKRNQASNNVFFECMEQEPVKIFQIGWSIFQRLQKPGSKDVLKGSLLKMGLLLGSIFSGAIFSSMKPGQ